MSQVNANRADAAPNRRVVDVAAPQAGQNVTVSALTASELKLAFDPDRATAIREGNSLVFVPDTGGKVVITDFFSVGEEPLPTLFLPDGSRVGAADWLAAIYPDMDLSTAAGPNSAAPPSSGASAYSDDAGSLLDGVDKFGDQEGSGGWGNIAPRTAEIPPAARLVALGTGGAAGSAGDGSTDPGGDDGGGEPKPYTPLNTLHLHHYDPVQNTEWWGDKPGPKGEYDYTARMATGAAGVGETADGTAVPDAWENGDFHLNILADNAAMTPDAGTDASVVSGVFAANGAKTSINANNIEIDVTGQGFEGGSGSSVVSAVFAQGAMEEGEKRSEDHQIHHAEVTLKADGDIALSMDITGDTGAQDHSGVTYAAVAASDRAHVTLESGGDVSIAITDQTTGGALDAAGIYGIYSGYRLRDKDIPRSEFASDEEYERYLHQLDNQYTYEDSEGDWGSEGYTRGTDQSIVEIKAAGNVDVSLDLGSIAGPAAGVQLEYGDVRIDAGGDINIATTLRGATEGDAAKASAVSIFDGGRLDLWAEGDVNLSMHGDGRNMSVLRIADSILTDRSGGSSGLDGTIVGKNVNIIGTAGANGVADVNDIIGIEMSAKKNKFLLSAEEKITVDVTTFHHGNQGAATGILIHTPTSNGTATSLFMDAPDIEIAARIKPANGAEGLAHDTTATALRVDKAHVDIERGEKGSDDDPYVNNYGMLEKLSLIAEGGRWNYGIHATGGGSGGDSFPTYLNLRSAELDIHAAGGIADGQGSGSYGIVAKGEGEQPDAQVYLYGGKLSVTVENPVESVGLQADNGQIMIENGRDEETGEYLALTVIISCTITDPSLLPDGARAVAIEALNGGKVSIAGHETWWDPGTSDSVVLNGDVIARGENAGTHYGPPNSSIVITLGGDSDSVTINGNITADEKGVISIDTGADSDRIEINGNITAGDNGSVSIDAGSGNDVLFFSGKINASDSLYITGGDGEDLLVLKAANLQAFEEQFKDWLESGALNTLSCESFIIHGVDSNNAPSWFSNLLAAHPEINVQFFGADTNITLVNTADQLSGAFALDGSGADDLLYLRFGDDAEQGLQNLQHAMENGKVSGLEKLVLDLANGHADDNLDSLLNNLIGEMKENSTEVRLRVDGADMEMLQNNGWGTQGNTTTLDGSEYTVYHHDDLGEMYVKLVTTG